MNFNIEVNYKNYDSKIKDTLRKLNDLFLEESYKGNKVAYYYQRLDSEDRISYNENICFYAASTIKILVCIILLEKYLNNELDLEEELLVKVSDLKQDTGVLKYNTEDKKYSIIKLIELCIVESDNTAYLKLVNLVGKDYIKEYGNKLGAKNTMLGKETDSFGLINCIDASIYLDKLNNLLKIDDKYIKMFTNYLENPSYKIIDTNKSFIRKYGSYEIAFHEIGIMNNEYKLIVLTQLNKMDYKFEFVNKCAKYIEEINNMIYNK